MNVMFYIVNKKTIDINQNMTLVILKKPLLYSMNLYHKYPYKNLLQNAIVFKVEVHHKTRN